MLVSAMWLGACGGTDDSTSPPSTGDALETVTLAGFPHSVDLYQPKHFTRAVVFLHGGAGTKAQVAYSLGLNATQDPPTSASIDFAWLNANGILAVFPQGQNLPSAPSGRTWSNHAMDSGADDVAFLQALAAYLRSRYGIASVALAGHSMGGTMANRMWCEAPAAFNAYVSIAGPASRYYLNAGTPCAPVSPAPYMGIIGGSDTVMQDSDWTAQTWLVNPILSLTPGFVDARVIGEWVQLGRRTSLRCGEVPQLDGKQQTGAVGSWTHCGGAIVQRLVDGADHGIDSIEAATGKSIRDYVAAFTAAF